MSKYEDTKEVASRTMILFFVADTSGSMEGSKIGTLNEAINNVIPEIRDISEKSADAKIKIAALKFSAGAEWLYPNPIEAESFQWRYLDAETVTDFGVACEKLNEKLSRENGFMEAASGSFAPAIFLFSDGGPTDNYHDALAKLNGNKWFEFAIKVAVAIGDDVNEDALAVLSEFTGNKETVIKVHTPEALKKLIRFIVVTSSQIGAKSQDVNATGKTKQEAVATQVQTYVADQLNDSDQDDWP